MNEELLLYGGGALLGLFVLSRLFRPRRRRRTFVDPVREVTLTLGCTERQALELLNEYQGNAARVIMDVKQGRKALPVEGPVSGGFAVILGPDVVKEPVPMARLVAEAAGITHPEAMKMLHPGAGGVLVQGLTPEVAAAVRQALQEKGHEAYIMAADRLPRAVFGGDVRALEMDDEGLSLSLMDRSTRRLRWEHVLLLCVGVLEPECAPSRDGTVPAARGDLTAHLYGGSGELHRYVLQARRFNYSHLGERKRNSAVTNFQLLIEELVNRAPAAATARSVHTFLADLKAPPYKSQDELASDGMGRLIALAASQD